MLTVVANKQHSRKLAVAKSVYIHPMGVKDSKSLLFAPNKEKREKQLLFLVNLHIGDFGRKHAYEKLSGKVVGKC